MFILDILNVLASKQIIFQHGINRTENLVMKAVESRNNNTSVFIALF